MGESVGNSEVHLDIVAEKRPSGECRTAYPSRGGDLSVAAAADKAEQGEHEHDDQDDPEQAHSVTPFVFGRLGLVSLLRSFIQERHSRCDGYAVCAV